MKNLLLILALISAISACKSKSSSDNPDDPQINNSDTIVAQKVYAWVNDLNVREAPSTSAKSVGKLIEGEAADFFGEKAGKTETITLRGKKITADWMKIKTLSFEGWVFEGAMKFEEVMTEAERARLKEIQGGPEIWQIIPGSRVGLITTSSSEKELIEKYGKENVIASKVHIGEGEFVDGTIVFQGKPQHAEVTWKNEKEKMNPETVRIAMKGSAWEMENGIKLGTPLTTLLELNGRKISFAGFGWDFEGRVRSFNRGNLSWLEGKVGLRLFTGNSAMPHKFFGEADHWSDEQGVDSLNLVVDEIIVQF